MICIHSRRDFRPNNVNGCWNGANEVKYAAINAGPRFYNAFSSHVQGKAGTDPEIGRVDKAEKMSNFFLECGASHGSSLG